jgi:PAS domain S-box-containing protein
MEQEQKKINSAGGKKIDADFLKMVIDSFPHPFYVIDANDYILKMANKACAPNGLSEGLTCHALTHKNPLPCNGKEHPCTIEEIKKTGSPVVFEHIHYTHNGEARNYEVHGYPIFDDSGDVVQVIESSVDITERKRAESALLESKQDLKDFLDNATDLIQSVAPDGSFLFVNSGWKELLGYDDSDLPGLMFNDIIHPEKRDHCKGLFKKVLEGNGVHNVETVFVSKDGREIPVEGNINGRFREGLPVATRGIFRDITVRRKAEEERERLISELQEALIKIRTLKELIPVCAWCRNVRDDKGYWDQLENYIKEHAGVRFTHGICPECVKKIDPELHDDLFDDDGKRL